MKKLTPKRSEKEIIDNLNSITSSYAFIKIIAALILRDFCGSIENLANKNVHEHLNYNEFSFLIGLWLKNVDFSKTSLEQAPQEVLKKVDALMLELHHTIFFNEFDHTKVTNGSLYDMFTNGNLFKEAFFYSATGAYDYQYIKWASEKYKHDKIWLLDKKGIELNAISPFFNRLRNVCQTKLKNIVSKSNLQIEDALEVFSYSRAELITSDLDDKPILENLAVELGEKVNQGFNNIGDFNIFCEKPIIKLPNDKFLIPLPYYVAEAIYESPFYWMNEDKNYLPIAAKNRGDVAEEIVYEMIKDLFGSSYVYKNVIIKESKSQTLTDIDILATYGGSAIVFQIKSKKLTALSKKGDIFSIKSDFTKAIRNAYTQACVSKDALLDTKNYSFELSDGTKLDFERTSFSSHVVIALLDDYPAISHQTHILFGEEVEETPVAINIFDLEVLVRYLNSPEKFTDYIIKRTKFSKYYRAQNEMSFLGFHIQKGLKKRKKFDYIYLDESWAQYIDSDYYAELAGVVPPTLETILKTQKIGRNDLCPCGSGKKYKKCHL